MNKPLTGYLIWLWNGGGDVINAGAMDTEKHSPINPHAYLRQKLQDMRLWGKVVTD